MIAVLLALALAQVDVSACKDASQQCRQAAGVAVLLERKGADTCSVFLDRCESKLGARTSTVIRELVPVPPPSLSSSGYSLETIIVVAAIVAVLFGVVGYGLGQGGDPQTVVVR